MKKFLLSLTIVGLFVLALCGAAGAMPLTLGDLATTVASTSSSTLRPVWATQGDAVAPTLGTVAPTGAANDIDTPVTINGSGFAAVMDGTGTVVLTAPTVSLGTTPLTNVSFVDSSTLTATVPWGMDPRAYALTVVNPDGGSVSLPAAFTVTQGIGQWNGGNLFGGSVTQILMKPGDPNTIYALAGEVGLFRSRDAGEHWSFASGNVIGGADFAIDPLHPTWLYTYAYGDAGHAGLRRSKDEGDTWTTLTDPFPNGVAVSYREVYVSPHDPQVLFLRSAPLHIASVGQARSASPGTYGLIKSTDGGASWITVADMNGVAVQDVAFHPTDSLQMVLATQSGQVFRSSDGGNHWSQVTKPSVSSVSTIAYNPYRPAEVWVASDLDGGMYKSVDASLTAWQDVRLTGGTGSSFITFTSADSVYTNSHHSGDGGLNWQRFGPMTGSGGLAFNPTNPQIGYIGDETYGVQKTSNGGQSWAVKSQGLAGMNCYSMEVSRADSLRVFATFWQWPGIYRSNDGASNWTYFPIAGSSNVRQVREDPFDSLRLFAAADNSFYVSADGGGSWSDLGWNLPPSSPAGGPYALEADPYQSGHLLVGLNNGRATGHVYASSNYGASWQAVTVPQDLSFITDIAFDPETPGLAYLSTTTYAAGSGTGVYRSTDSGSSWTRIDDRQRTNMSDSRFGITIATHPRHVLCVGTQEQPYRSLDGGATWEMLGPPDNSGMVAFMFAGADSTRLYAAMWSGLWSSNNTGDSWTRATGILGGLHTTALGSATVGGHTVVYAATCGGAPGASSSRAVRSPRNALAAAGKMVNAGIYRYVFLPAPKLTLKLSGLKSGTLKLGRSLKLSGKVSPSRFAGSKVRLTVQRKVRKWVTVKTVMRTSSASGVFGWKYKPTKKGAFRLQATIAKTTRTAAAKTKWRSFRVK